MVFEVETSDFLAEWNSRLLVAMDAVLETGRPQTVSIDLCGARFSTATLERVADGVRVYETRSGARIAYTIVT